jgi:hypothetical protein
MTTLHELLVLISAIIAVFGSLAVAYWWINAFTKWVWLLTVRRWLVIGVTLFILLAVFILVQLLTHLDMLTSLGFLIGLIATPLMAVPLADYIAFRCAPIAHGAGHGWRNFIFAEKRRKQSHDYSAPSIDP